MDPFLVKLALSFIVGGAYIAFTIWLSEKLGSKIGGLLIGLPSTTLVSLLFIAWTQSPQTAVKAVPIVPLVMGANCLYAASFVRLYKRGVALALGASFLLLLALTVPFAWLGGENLGVSLLVAALYYAAAIYLLKGFPHRKLEDFRSSKRTFFFRAGVAGSVVAAGVFMSKAFGPLWGGLFGTFPAAFTSTMLLLARAHGIEFTSSVVRTFPYGSLGSVAFAVGFFYLVPLLGLVEGTLSAYLVAAGVAVLLYHVVLSKD